MTRNYILIDYENVQPPDLGILNGHDVSIHVFLGANQTKLPSSLAMSLQPFGKNAQYILISGNGRNALDFHLAFYLGKLAEADPAGYFHVVSKDKGFDPLVAHLKSRKVRAHRVKDLSELPFLGAPADTSKAERITQLVNNLHARGTSRPRKRKTLLSTIHAHFNKELEVAEVEALLAELIERGWVVLEGETVTYRPPIIRG